MKKKNSLRTVLMQPLASAFTQPSPHTHLQPPLQVRKSCQFQHTYCVLGAGLSCALTSAPLLSQVSPGAGSYGEHWFPAKWLEVGSQFWISSGKLFKVSVPGFLLHKWRRPGYFTRGMEKALSTVPGPGQCPLVTQGPFQCWDLDSSASLLTELGGCLLL